MSFSIIVAADEANGIGKDGGLPWHLPGDMAFFKRTTLEAPTGKQNVVIMGRKTWDSIPTKFRPLKGRCNVIVTRAGLGYRDDRGENVAGSLDDALHAFRLPDAHRTFVIGGAQIYREALNHAECAEVLFTRVHARFECDTFLPAFDQAFALSETSALQQDGDVSYTWETYVRRS